MPALSAPFVADLAFPEAPRWHDGQLWFSDMIGRRVCTVDEAGILQSTAHFDDMPGGIGFLPDGTPLVVGMTSSLLFAIRDGHPEVYAELCAGSDVHLDDMAVSADGTAYVGAVGTIAADAKRMSDGAIMRVTPDGTVTREAGDLAFPNGMAISHDGTTLLVNETFAERVTAFDITTDGRLSNRRKWAALPGTHPDGLAVDSDGAVWVGCYAEEKFVRVRKGGEVTHVLPTPGRWATGVALGGPDGHTLFLATADTDQRRFFRGDSHGRLDTVRVEVPAPNDIRSS
ncbi:MULTISPECIES: SMP-30/gluconolactonase/LRE family protein [unclassified Mycobacterium]|uniref:SMP-30/gluconolactonase/LRE family protein n=1 Tax=unclassified Mycobacterium TaxID=2642494 RepID=UPI0029C86B7B|nr:MULTISPECIES: SMP-30/gluconolactonase/LRE family protein [unclassified Mycobacterium]